LDPNTLHIYIYIYIYIIISKIIDIIYNFIAHKIGNMEAVSVFTKSNLKKLRKSIEPLFRTMRGGSLENAAAPTTTVGWQIIETIIIVVVFSVTMQSIESGWEQLKRYQNMAVDMFPASVSDSQVFTQDPSSGFPLLEPSKDERNGAEYSYACFINIDPDTFDSTSDGKLKHIFHKGSPLAYPLVAPGVFLRTDTNTLRIYHNSTKNWNNYIDIPNIPIQKWVHLVVSLKGNFLDVYINGNLANRMVFTDVPKLNFSDFYLLADIFSKKKSCDNATTADSNKSTSNATTTNTTTANATSTTTTNVGAVATTETTPVTTNTILTNGMMKGTVSNLKYFAYALSYTQIDQLLREGPIMKKFVSKKQKAKELVLQYAEQTHDWATSDRHSGLGPQ